MENKPVDIVIKAVDEASAKIKTVEKSLKTLGGTSAKMAAPLGAMTGLLAGGWSTVGTVINLAGQAISIVGRIAGTVFSAITDVIDRVISAVSGLASKLLSTAGIMTGVFLTAVGALTRQAVLLSASFEQSQMAFTTMLGSKSKADAFLSTLQQFANVTPFKFSDLTTMTQRLMAYGFESKSIIPTLTAIGDSVSALGGSPEMLNRVVTAMGQIRAKGKLSAEEMRQLAEAGIPAWQMVANYLGTTIPVAMKRAETGAIDAASALTALTSGMNSQFGGMMEVQSRTLAGRWSTLLDSIEMGMRKLGEPIGRALNPVIAGLTGVVNYLSSSGALEKIGATIAGWFSPNTLGNVINWFSNVYALGANAVQWVWDKLSDMFDWFNEKNGQIQTFWANFMSWGSSAIQWIKAEIADLWNSPALKALKWLFSPNKYMQDFWSKQFGIKGGENDNPFPAFPKWGDVMTPGALPYQDALSKSMGSIKGLGNPSKPSELANVFKESMENALSPMTSPMQSIADATQSTAANTASMLQSLSGTVYGGGEQSKLAIQRFLFGGASIPQQAKRVDIRITGGTSEQQQIAKQAANAVVEAFGIVSPKQTISNQTVLPQAAF